MSQLLEHPAVQGGVAPFVVALVVALALGRTRFAWLAIVAGWATSYVLANTHSIRYQSDIDSIEITHSAFNRRGFASGAVLAAEFLVGKKGVFSMSDVLGL